VAGKCSLLRRSLCRSPRLLTFHRPFLSQESLPFLLIRLQTPAKQAMGLTGVMTASTKVPWRVSFMILHGGNCPTSPLFPPRPVATNNQRAALFSPSITSTPVAISSAYNHTLYEFVGVMFASQAETCQLWAVSAVGAL
jgi:hypothetical protein